MAVLESEIILYLSGGMANRSPAASLGGARSSTIIATNVLNALFDDVSAVEAHDGDVEYRCFYIRFETADADGAEDPRLFVEPLPPAGVSIAVGVDLAGKNATADTIDSEGTAPDPAVTFVTPTTDEGGLELPGGPYRNGDYVAIWVRRAISAQTPGMNPLSFGLQLGYGYGVRRYRACSFRSRVFGATACGSVVSALTYPADTHTLIGGISLSIGWYDYTALAEGLRITTELPGGFKSLTFRMRGSGVPESLTAGAPVLCTGQGAVLFKGRLASTPDFDAGEEQFFNVEAEGDQARLRDRADYYYIGVDADTSQWQSHIAST